MTSAHVLGKALLDTNREHSRRSLRLSKAIYTVENRRPYRFWVAGASCGLSVLNPPPASGRIHGATQGDSPCCT
jgi:hypothetical protein